MFRLLQFVLFECSFSSNVRMSAHYDLGGKACARISMPITVDRTLLRKRLQC